MPIKQWLIQYLIAFPVVFTLLAGVQYIKGRDLQYCIEFGVLWGVISIAIFALRRVYIYKKNTACIIKNTSPKAEKRDNDRA